MVSLFKFQLRNTGVTYSLERAQGEDARVVSDSTAAGDALLLAAQLEVERTLDKANRDYHFTPDHVWAEVAKLLKATDVTVNPVDPVSEEGVVY